MVAWEKTAEFIIKYFQKGSRIFVEGRVQNNNYKDNNGVMRYSVDVIVENVEFGGGRQEKPAEKKVNDGFEDDFTGDEISDDSVPF